MTISYGRTRGYIQAANAELFAPRGLHCTILSTKELMAKVDLNEEQQTRVLSSSLSHADAQNVDDLDEIDSRRVVQLQEEYGGEAPVSRIMAVDPRLQRLKALEGFWLHYSLTVCLIAWYKLTC